jgi:hypothetical protein
VQSIKSVGVGQVLHVVEYRVDFKLGVLIREAPSIGEAHIRDYREGYYY